MYYTIALSIASLALIVCVCYYLNNKVADFKESFNKPQSSYTEQAIIDETTDEAVAVDVVDSTIIKVVKHEEAPAVEQKKARAKKTTRKSQNNAKLRAKKI